MLPIFFVIEVAVAKRGICCRLELVFVEREKAFNSVEVEVLDGSDYFSRAAHSTLDVDWEELATNLAADE